MSFLEEWLEDPLVRGPWKGLKPWADPDYYEPERARFANLVRNLEISGTWDLTRGKEVFWGNDLSRSHGILACRKVTEEEFRAGLKGPISSMMVEYQLAREADGAVLDTPLSTDRWPCSFPTYLCPVCGPRRRFAKEVKRDEKFGSGSQEVFRLTYRSKSSTLDAPQFLTSVNGAFKQFRRTVAMRSGRVTRYLIRRPTEECFTAIFFLAVPQAESERVKATRTWDVLPLGTMDPAAVHDLEATAFEAERASFNQPRVLRCAVAALSNRNRTDWYSRRRSEE